MPTPYPTLFFIGQLEGHYFELNEFSIRPCAILHIMKSIINKLVDKKKISRLTLQSNFANIWVVDISELIFRLIYSVSAELSSGKYTL